MKPVPYKDILKDEWDTMVRESRNGTFLFLRDYMDYHKDRFADVSLFFYNEKGKPVAGLPASRGEDGASVCSHAGLTYGGLILSPSANVLDVCGALASAAAYYMECGYKNMIYKPVPHIYHSVPSEEDLYWLYRAGGKLTSRSISTAVSLHDPLPLSQLRKRKVEKAKKLALHVGGSMGCENLSDWQDFWKILDGVLKKYHDTRPVHSLEEILLLHNRFPHSIKLFTVKNCSGDVVAGCVAFISRRVVHIQYIASGEEGRLAGALDLLFAHLIDHYKESGKGYFDFGISTELGGSYLNKGLIFQKEGFGGRAVCYDTYRVQLSQLMKIDGHESSIS